MVGKVSQQDWPEEKVEQLHKAWTRWSAAQGPEGKTPTQNAICVKLSSLLMLLYLKGVCSPHIQSAVVCIDRFCDFLCSYNLCEHFHWTRFNNLLSLCNFLNLSTWMRYLCGYWRYVVTFLDSVQFNESWQFGDILTWTIVGNILLCHR